MSRTSSTSRLLRNLRRCTLLLAGMCLLFSLVPFAGLDFDGSADDVDDFVLDAAVPYVVMPTPVLDEPETVLPAPRASLSSPIPRPPTL